MFDFSKTGWHKIVYYFFLYSSYFFYGILLIAILGGLPNLELSHKIPEYLTILQNALKYYVCFFLIIRFNPFISYSEFTQFDADIVFSSAIFLLLTTSLTSIITDYANEYVANPSNPNSPFKKNISLNGFFSSTEPSQSTQTQSK
jgi:hypothetical protein